MIGNCPHISQLDRDAIEDLGLFDDDHIESNDSAQHEAVTPIVRAGTTPRRAGLIPRKQVVRK